MQLQLPAKPLGGDPAAQARPKAKGAAKADAISKKAIERKVKAMVAALTAKGAVMEGSWVLLKEVLKALELPNHHTTRDYLTGPTAWRLGSGRGKLLKIDNDWCYIHGKRGGGRGQGHPHIKARCLKGVLRKYYGNRLLVVRVRI